MTCKYAVPESLPIESVDTNVLKFDISLSKPVFGKSLHIKFGHPWRPLNILTRWRKRDLTLRRVLFSKIRVQIWNAHAKIFNLTPCNGLYDKNWAHNKAKRTQKQDSEVSFFFQLRFGFLCISCHRSLNMDPRPCSLIQEVNFFAKFDYIKQNLGGVNPYLKILKS